MTPPRVLFVCDAGPAVGGGHVMRSLTLADALTDRGATCVFLETASVGRVLDAFDRRGHGRVAIPDVERVDAHGAAAAIAAGGADAVVVDHFLWRDDHDAHLRSRTRVLIAIDDLADRPRDVDVLLDPTFDRRLGDYDALLPPRAVRLLGPSYALVRPPFAERRPAALARRSDPAGPTRALIALGLTDVGGVTGRVLDALTDVRSAVALDVVTGSAAPSAAALSARLDDDPLATLHIDAPDMPELMLRADVAVGAGGSSTWERACLGLPTLTLILAENQRPLARRLEQAGVTVAIDLLEPDWPERLRVAWTRLLTDGDFRRGLSDRAAALCDGLGADRVADAVMERLAA